MATAPALVYGSTPQPEWQTDSSSDTELEHESDGMADVRTTIAQRPSPGDIGLAVALLGGIAGCMMLASRQIRAPRASEHDRKNL